MWTLWNNVMPLLWATILGTAATFGGASVVQLVSSNIGVRLTGHVITERNTGSNLQACARFCSDVTRCLSFNYSPTSGVCELNSANKTSVNPSSLTSNGTFINVDIASWTLTDSVCSTKPCSETERCVPLSGQADGPYVCDERDTDCPHPPLYKNRGILSDGWNDKGSVRRYVCPAGRMVTGSSSEITCTGAQWTEPSFQCSYVTSCSDVKTCDSAYTDGEYWLHPQAFAYRRVKMYCHGMDSATPSEYVTVDPTENHSYNEQRNPAYSGRANFTKIGVTLLSDRVEIVTSDHTFIESSGIAGSLVYGKASSCVCGGCARGTFRINTTVTGFILDQTVVWNIYGAGSVIKNFERSPNGDVISANCGGHCGYCYPNKALTLHLNPDHVIADLTEAILPVCN